MTEAEWLDKPDDYYSIQFFNNRVSERRRRLLACACCRRVWDLLPQDSIRKCIVLAESYADGEITEAELNAARHHPYFADLQNHWRGAAKVIPQLSLRTLYAISTVEDLINSTADVYNTFRGTSLDAKQDYIPTPQHNEVTGGGGIETDKAEIAEKVRLLRDIFGNPFRPVTFDPAWRTEQSVGLARMMYEKRTFDAMPILSDALQDAGCDNEDILRHCREPGVHVRGCWVVDLVLGKE
jgi:hypothetical protein